MHEGFRDTTTACPCQVLGVDDVKVDAKSGSLAASGGSQHKLSTIVPGIMELLALG